MVLILLVSHSERAAHHSTGAMAFLLGVWGSVSVSGKPCEWGRHREGVTSHRGGRGVACEGMWHIREGVGSHRGGRGVACEGRWHIREGVRSHRGGRFVACEGSGSSVGLPMSRVAHQ